MTISEACTEITHTSKKFSGTADVKLFCAEGLLTATTQPGITYPTVRVWCSRPDSPQAASVRKTQIVQQGKTLEITVPKPEPGTRMVPATFTGNAGNAGLPVMRKEPDTIRVDMTIPQNAYLTAAVGEGGIRVRGTLAVLLSSIGKGDLVTDDVYSLSTSMLNGNVTAQFVRNWMNLEVDKGNVDIGKYAGVLAKVRVERGNVVLCADREASGILGVSTGRGNIVLSGVKHNEELDLERVFAEHGSVDMR